MATRGAACTRGSTSVALVLNGGAIAMKMGRRSTYASDTLWCRGRRMINAKPSQSRGIGRTRRRAA